LLGHGAARRRFELTDCRRQGDDHHSLHDTPVVSHSVRPFVQASTYIAGNLPY
jgi:hypothetical protein